MILEKDAMFGRGHLTFYFLTDIEKHDGVIGPE